MKPTRLILLLTLLVALAAGGINAQPAPTPFPFSSDERNISPPSNDRPYQPIDLDHGTDVRPEVKEILDQIEGCDVQGARILLVYNIAKSGEPTLPLDLPGKAAAADGKRTTLIVGNTQQASGRRNANQAHQQYLQLIDVAQSIFSSIFIEAGLDVVTSPDMAQLIYDSTTRGEAIANERAFLEKAKEAALMYDAEYILLYYVSFKDVGYSGESQAWHDVQDTMHYEMYRVGDGMRISGRPYRAAGRSDVDFEDAHYQNMQRLVDVGLDGDLGVQVLRDIIKFCRRTAGRGDTIQVGLYYQGNDPSPVALGLKLSEVLKSREVNTDGAVRRTESRVQAGESYSEYSMKSAVNVDELEAFLYEYFVAENALEDRFIASFTGTGNALVIQLLDETKGGDWRASALNPANRAMAAARAEQSTDREFSTVELTRQSERGTVLVEAVGIERQPAAGVLLTYSGIVVTDASISEGARNFIVHFGGTGPDAQEVTMNAYSLATLSDAKLEILQIEGFELPDGVEPLVLGDSDKVQENDKVFAAAPRTRKYPRARGRQGTIERIQRGGVSEIIHTAVLEELTNGAPLLNTRGEVVGICRTAMKASGYTSVTQREGDAARTGDELANPDQLMTRDERVRAESSSLKLQFGVAVPTNVLIDAIGREELDAVKKGNR